MDKTVGGYLRPGSVSLNTLSLKKQRDNMESDEYVKWFNSHSLEWRKQKINEMNLRSNKIQKERHHMEQELDDTISEATDLVNKHYEELLHELFTLGDYIFDLKIEYKDVDGKTISMSWQDRDKRIDWLHGNV